MNNNGEIRLVELERRSPSFQVLEAGARKKYKTQSAPQFAFTMNNGTRIAIRSNDDLKKAIEETLKIQGKFVDLEVLGAGAKAPAPAPAPAPVQAPRQPGTSLSSRLSPLPLPCPRPSTRYLLFQFSLADCFVDFCPFSLLSMPIVDAVIYTSLAVPFNSPDLSPQPPLPRPPLLELFSLSLSLLPVALRRSRSVPSRSLCVVLLSTSAFLPRSFPHRRIATNSFPLPRASLRPLMSSCPTRERSSSGLTARLPRHVSPVPTPYLRPDTPLCS